MLVTRTGARFDWTPNPYFETICKDKIPSHSTIRLPAIKFKVPINAKLGVHGFRHVLSYELRRNKKWTRFKSKGRGSGHIFVEKSKLDPSKRLFLSHSNSKNDLRLISTLKKLLRNCGMEVWLAEDKPRPGHPLWKKIQRLIRRSNYFVVFWTKNAAKSGDVREEIGISLGYGKRNKTAYFAEVPPKGSLRGTEYLPLNRRSRVEFLNAVEKLVQWVRKSP
jgi:hypothetical protein